MREQEMIGGTMPKMRVVQISRPKGPFELVEREIPEPGAGWVRIKVQACGICHSDALTKEGIMPGIQYPRVPGHEVAGLIDAVEKGVKCGRLASGSGSAGMVGTVALATFAGEGTFLPVNSDKSPVSPMMGATPIT